MNDICILPKNLANQIAAGEVVERPVSVVKELVENSLDAGATSICVEIRNGGMEEIVVTDTWAGISPQGLSLLWAKHATSKIGSLEDLYKVLTFWFRWEAIASISSVSDFEIQTRTQNHHGGKSMKIIFWEKQSLSEVWMEVWTKIIVRNLFWNTPARLNYLKSANTEKGHIEDFLKNMSLAYSHVWFSLFVDGKKSFLFASEPDETQRIFHVFWEDFYNNILPLSFSYNGVTINGYITHPRTHFQNKERQVLFINKRLVRSFSLYKAISDAYNRFIPHGTYPGYVLHLSLDPTEVDVNVHPRKLEVRFAREQEVFRALYHAVEKTLDTVSLVGGAGTTWTISQPVHTFSEPKQYFVGSGSRFQSYSPYKDTSHAPNQSQISQALDFTKEILHWTSFGNELSEESPYGKIVGQVFKSYIIVEGKEKLIVFDQHALAERVIFERLCQKQEIVSTQKLLVPHTLHLTPKELSVFVEHQSVFEEMGFEAEQISWNSIIMNAIPDFIRKERIEEIFHSLLTDVGEQSFTENVKTLDEVKNKLRAYTACRSAIKFWDILTMHEMKQLLQDAQITYSATCPHGRPVVFEIDLQDLKWRFDR